MALSRTQEKAARLLGLELCATKAEVCRKVGCSKRSLYNCLKDEEFLAKIEEYRRSAEVQLTPDYIIENTSAEDKVQLMKMLQNDEEVGKHLLPEIKSLIVRVRKADQKFDDLILKEIKKELQKVIGRIEFKLGSKAYSEEGDLISPETDWYEMMDELGENYRLIDIMVEADYEDKMDDGHEIYRAGRKHKAYQTVIDGIEEGKRKLKATGKVIEADP